MVVTAVQIAKIRDLISKLSICTEEEAKKIYKDLKELMVEYKVCESYKFWSRCEIIKKKMDVLCKEAQNFFNNSKIGETV